ncbi:tripartite motif-containing protein 16-like isoform X1 [Silurus meridionalis]|nr:tripartite motif-containing protein 16-like isoform X1 [Silurus meridionalis]
MDENTAKPVDLSSAADLDVCTERKRKATSFCEDHKDQHGVLEKRQKMMTATKSLKRSLCPRHGKLMELFCRKDQQCICNLCLTYKHNNHDVVLIKDEVPEKTIKLEKMQMQTTKLIQTREKQEQALKRAIHSFETSAVRAVKENDKSFTELIRSIDKKQRAVKELITAQEEAVLKQVNALSERMEREISDLKSIDAKLQLRLSQADNDIGFLQTASIPHLPKSIQIPALVVHPSGPFQLITNDASNLIKQLRLLCQWRFMTISERVKNTGIISTPLPQTYQELLKYAFKLTLDTNTVHDLLKLSNLNKELTAVEKPECRPSHRDRFERRLQVLCREGLRGAPHYWEVECGMKGSWVIIAVSYKGITRKGKKAPLFGRCKNSWALRNYGGIYEFWHDDKCLKTHKDSSLDCSKIGIFLDHGAGVLAFYNVSGNVFSRIFKVQTHFEEPVYAGFGLVGIGSRIQLCDL